jgi:deazaflavin-dependent oxidoreductase (nitroreductase family)
MTDEVFDNPTDWVNEHIQRYLRTGGADGGEWQPGVPCLLLTTRGRKSGLLRRTALIYGRKAAAYVVVASRGGKPTHPAWYLNLRDNPDVTIQVGPDVMQGHATTASQRDRPDLWRQMIDIWPLYITYQESTDREIPLVLIEPARMLPATGDTVTSAT